MAKRALSVDAILARRAEEDAALRDAVAEIDVEIDQLKQRRAALVAALGAPQAGAPPPDLAPTGPRQAKCLDCGARVTVTEAATECPACGAEPFEE